MNTSAANDTSLSPNRRAWARFRRNRMGFVSLWIFTVLLVLTSCAELIANDKPLVARYQGEYYFPILQNYPEEHFGGDFKTPTDWLDPFIARRFSQDGNWALFSLIPYGATTVNYFASSPSPSPPTLKLKLPGAPPAPPGPPKPDIGPRRRTSSYSLRLASSPTTS